MGSTFGPLIVGKLRFHSPCMFGKMSWYEETPNLKTKTRCWRLAVGPKMRELPIPLLPSAGWEALVGNTDIAGASRPRGLCWTLWA